MGGTQTSPILGVNGWDFFFFLVTPHKGNFNNSVWLLCLFLIHLLDTKGLPKPWKPPSDFYYRIFFWLPVMASLSERG